MSAYFYSLGMILEQAEMEYVLEERGLMATIVWNRAVLIQHEDNY